MRLSVRPAWLLSAAALVLAGTLAVRATDLQEPRVSRAGQPAKNVGDLSPHEEEAFAILGEETTERVCSACHPVENITKVRRTLRQWDDMVVAMVARGAPGTERQFATISQYLARYYGVVHVNSASADELSAVLGLSSRDAAAVVEYRKVHGRFADAAALSRVEGIDKAKVDAQALRFDDLPQPKNAPRYLIAE